MDCSIILILTDNVTHEIRYESVILPDNCVLNAVATFNGHKFETFTCKWFLDFFFLERDIQNLLTKLYTKCLFFN